MSMPATNDGGWASKAQTINWNIFAGVIRTVGPVLGTMLAAYLAIPTDVWSQIVSQAADLVIAIGSVVTLIATIWSVWSNWRTSVAKQAASVNGVVVVAGTNAPDDIKKVANDPDHQGVIPAHAFIPEPPAGAG